MKDKIIFKNGNFVRGTLIKDSIKIYPYFQRMKIIHATIAYFDDNTKQTFLFNTWALIDIRKLKKVIKTNEELSVLVVYLPQNYKENIVFLNYAVE